MSTNTIIDRDLVLDEIIASAQAEKAQRNLAAEKATRQRIEDQFFLGLEQGVQNAQKLADTFPALKKSAYENLETEIANRHDAWRGRFHLPQANAGVHRAVSQLTLMMNGHLEALMSLEQVKTKYEDAKRLRDRDRVAAQRKPEQD
ncbi:hypothetical protein [Granulicella sp. S190]|uniref:hypothetical protein n=1 Tax=Granulicella sp. S190 TaxID=1747226 RepID=UPI00131D1738|nr:hypothetical protein [Granulicella sp. S190]